MLTENNVVDAVAAYLTQNGYKIIKKCYTTQKGVDIIAKNKNSHKYLYIEAKGKRKAKIETGESEKSFPNKQIRSHIPKAIYSSLKVISQHSGKIDAGIALPNTEFHKKMISEVTHALRKLDIVVFWVDDDMSVSSD